MITRQASQVNRGERETREVERRFFRSYDERCGGGSPWDRA
jgi:hypothetical protein